MFRIAAEISRVTWSGDTEARIREGLSILQKEGLDGAFLDYCIKWRLAPWVRTQLGNNKQEGLIGPDTLKGFHLEYEKVKKENDQRARAVTGVLKEFSSAGLDVAVLKGNYFSEEIYHETGYKRMNDFDMLIRKDDWDRVQEIYLDLGFIPLGFGWGGEKEKPARYSHVGMSYISPDFTCILGSQWALKSPTTIYRDPGELLWDTSVPFTFRGVRVRALSPEYNLLHLILHMEIYKCGIRDCMDLYNLCLTREIDWYRLKEIITGAKAAAKARFTLELCNLCTEVFPEGFLAGLEAPHRGYLHRRLRARMKLAEESGDFQASFNDCFHEIEKDVIFFQLFPQFHRKLVYFVRILRRVFLARRPDRLKLIDKPHRPGLMNRVAGFLKAPYLIMALTAQEIGWLFTLLLLFKLFIDLPVALFNYFLRKESYIEYLKNRGIDPEKIIRAVNNIQ